MILKPHTREVLESIFNCYRKQGRGGVLPCISYNIVCLLIPLSLHTSPPPPPPYSLDYEQSLFPLSQKRNTRASARIVCCVETWRVCTTLAAHHACVTLQLSRRCSRSLVCFSRSIILEGKKRLLVGYTPLRPAWQGNDFGYVSSI